jgi:bifunctional UDP-N-acetylglucosamine pyrophosphorylase/glucosamine-1-phosphate N-acetyltransferase
LTAKIDKPAQYGRILRDKYSCISGIVEAKDASDYQKEIKEINTGIMCFSTRGLSFALKRITPQNRTKEYYLTDAVELLYRNGFCVGGVTLEQFSEAMGINSRAELAEAERLMQKKINERVMQDGVTMVSPDTVFLAADARVGADTVIYPFVVVEQGAVIGKNCRIGPFAHLAANARVKDHATVRGTAWIK